MPLFALPPSVLSLPPCTRSLTALLILLSALLFLLRISSASSNGEGAASHLKLFQSSEGDVGVPFPWLVVVPGKVLWYPWTLVTSGFVETNLIEFLVSLLTLPLAGRYLERVWGQMEFLKFVLVVITASNVIACIVNTLEEFVIGGSGNFLNGQSYHGLMGLQVGFLVAFTQLIPEHQVQIFWGLGRVRVKSLPMLYVTVSNVACLLGYQSPWILIQFGWLVSWFYLRFVKLNEGGEFRGDRSETFAFAGWFPPFLQKYITILSTFVFNLAVRLRVIRPWTDLESGSAGGGNVLGGSGAFANVPGGARAEAERRRAMALKALDQRMASKPTPSSTTQTPSQPSSSSVPMVSSTSGGGSGSGHGTASNDDVKDSEA